MNLSRRSLLAGLPAAPALFAQTTTIYDLLLKSGQVLDPKNGRAGRLDIGIAGERIARVAARIPAASARLVVDAADYYVTPGLIDLHAHIDAQAEGSSLQPDHHCLPNGVTTVVDAGSANPANFEAYRRQTIARSKTRVLAWLRVTGDDTAPAAEVAKKHPGLIVGLRSDGPRVAGLPVMAERAGGLRSGDVLTGAYPSGGDGQARAARKAGALLDTASFWFRVAAPAIREGLLPDTVSTNLHKGSILLERANMMTALSKLLNLGMTVEQLIERVTVAPARVIRHPELGHLGEGAPADIALLELQKGKFGFLDAGHARLDADRRLRCVLTIRAGRVVWDSEGLSLTDWTNAGPYSNFK